MTRTFAQTEKITRSIKLPNNYSSRLNVIYTEVDNWKGTLDFYSPTDRTVATPLLINIHGGGWNHGVKETQTGFASFFKKGFAVANIEYRLESEGKAPSAIEDVRCALNYLIANAKELNLDKDKIIIMGSSAGAHLALMAGLSESDPKFDINCKRTDGIKIFAIIDKYGITDLSNENVFRSSSVQNWLGSRKDDPSFVKSVSPLYYVDEKSPPVFIVHGDADPTVPYKQSVELNKKLLTYDIKTKFVTVSDGTHGKFSDDEKRAINNQIWQFLVELGL